jgi:hypothetical protein
VARARVQKKSDRWRGRVCAKTAVNVGVLKLA